MPTCWPYELLAPSAHVEVTILLRPPTHSSLRSCGELNPDPLASRLNTLPKYVAARSVTQADWLP
jgi:hypothetical protein